MRNASGVFLKMNESKNKPRGILAIRQLAMPANLNTGGNIFGGWLLSQMDVAGGITASDRAKGRIATVAITAMEFHHPVFVGDVLCCYCNILKVGSSSITIHVEAWAHRRDGAQLDEIKVTEGDFVFVALNKDGSKRSVPSPS